ncbi:MAG: DedA family protein [Gemmatimonadota bacterium]|nr:DedA family protein [Gemmatimonadota bacterium]
MDRALSLLAELPAPLAYTLLAVGAAIENILPVVPADTFIVAGGFIAGLGTVHPLGVFGVVWGGNVGGAVAVYGAGRRYGPSFFRTGPGRRLAGERRMEKLQAFYRRWGLVAIFLARFLPGFRAVVPVFAGVTQLEPSRAIPPMVVASAIWYGALLQVGYLGGDNIEAVAATLEQANRGLLIASVALVVLIAGLWWRARRKGSRERSGVDADAD